MQGFKGLGFRVWVSLGLRLAACCLGLGTCWEFWVKLLGFGFKFLRKP